jgi:hypothetical protein
MFCPSCGNALSGELSYCNRCGAHLKSGKSATDSLLEGVFWTTVFGLGFTVGGIVALKKADVRDAFVLAYMILSALAFLGVYAMHVWQFIIINRTTNRNKNLPTEERFITGELPESGHQALPPPAASVTDHTTRSFEPVYRERNR